MKKKRRASSIVEMMIAVILLAVVLLGLLTGVTIARHSLFVKENEKARQTALLVLEDIESVPYENVTSKISQLNGQKVGDFVVEVQASDPGPNSVVVTVGVFLEGSGGTKVTMSREVSASGWQNAGEFPGS
jgi:hypothetical protein